MNSFRSFITLLVAKLPIGFAVAPALTVALVLTVATVTNAEIPNLSQAQLHAKASHALTGTVMNTYTRQEKKGNFVYTYGVAEISVASVDKGSNISGNDRVFVRYWRKKWTGRGNPPPGHFGHGNIPAKNSKVVVYVKGDRATGFDVMSPNGFFKVTKAK